MSDAMKYVLIQYNVQIDRYMGDGIILPLFVVCFFYLLFTNEKFRRQYGYGMLAGILLVFIPPLYFPLWHRLFGGITWRIFWMLCETFICCYAFIDVAGRCKKKVSYWLCIVFCVMVVALGGRFAYREGVFDKADNAYKLSQENIEIADYLLSLEEHPRVLTIGQVARQLRQYSDDIYMLFGRDTIGGSIAVEDERILEAAKAMKASRMDIPFLTELCREYQIRYMIVRRTKKNLDELEPNGWRQIEKIGKYNIYLLDN